MVARATTTNDYAILFETRLNFPNKVKKVAGLVSSQEKKERDAWKGERLERWRLKRSNVSRRGIFLIRILEYLEQASVSRKGLDVFPLAFCVSSSFSSFLFNFFPPLDAKGASGFPTTMLLSRGGRVIVPALWGEKPKITIPLFSTFLSSLPIFTFPNPRQGFAVVNSAGSTFFSILTSPPGKKKKKNEKGKDGNERCHCHHRMIHATTDPTRP